MHLCMFFFFFFFSLQDLMKQSKSPVLTYTAEGITRCLRSKDITTPQLCELGTQLIENKLPQQVNLPNKVVFVYDLLCDRLNNLRNAEFRNSTDVWRLLVEVLDQLPGNIMSKTLTKLNSAEILPLVSDYYCRSSKNVDLFVVTTKYLETVMSYSFLRLDNTQSVTFVSNFLKFCNASQHQLQHDMAEYIALIHKAFSGNNGHVSKYTTASVAQFCSKALPHVISIMCAFDNPSIQKQLKHIVSSTILAPAELSLLSANIERLVASKLHPICLTRLFELILQRTNDVASLEAAYSTIVESYPASAPTLFSLLSKVKKTLSTPFLTSVVSKNLNAKAVDHSLILSVINLDVEIGMNFADRILESFTSNGQSAPLQVVGQVIDCFVRLRNFAGFFPIWSKFLGKDPETFGNCSMVALVGRKSRCLSSSQTQELFESLAEHLESSLKTGSGILTRVLQLSALVHGLLANLNGQMSSSSSIEAAMNIMYVLKLKLLSIVLNSDDQLQSLPAYQSLCFDILSMVDEESLDSETTKGSLLPKFLKVALARDIHLVAKKYAFFSIFRLRELREFSVTTVMDKFLNLVVEEKDSAIIQDALDRWCVMINALCTKEQIKIFVDTSLKVLRPGQLVSLGRCSLFFHQLNLGDEFVFQIINQLKSSQPEDRSANLACFLDSYPSEYFTKFQRGELIAIISQKAIDGGDIMPYRKLALKVLSKATLKSELETNLETMLAFIGSCKSQEETELSSRIIELIFSAHLQHDSADSSFVENTLSSLAQKLKEAPNMINYQIAHAALRAFSNTELPAGLKLTIGSLQTQLCVCSIRLIDDSTREEDISHILAPLTELKLFQRLQSESDLEQELWNRLQSIGGSATPDVKAKLFTIQCQRNVSLDYIMPLYVVLRDECLFEVLRSDLCMVLSSLETEKLHDSFISVSQAFESHCTESYLELLLCCLSVLDKQDPESQKLLNRSLSTIINHWKPITASMAGVLHLLDFLKESLVERGWCFSQFGFELVAEIVSLASQTLQNLVGDQREVICEVYAKTAQILSTILQFHRYRFSHRHHLLVSCCVSLMETLFDKSTRLSETPNFNSIQLSGDCGLVFARLISNLCQPPMNQRSEENKLVLSSAVIKNNVRKHIHVLLLSYVKLSLTRHVNLEVKKELSIAIFEVFDILTQAELALVNASLDLSGKAMFKKALEDYKLVGKWKDDQ